MEIFDKNTDEHQEHHDLNSVSGLYQDWFLDYASYVILERAVPHIYDGLKPVQRRILHSMKQLDDGRYNKVANIIGHTMQYHPHGDASIGDALVQVGQKDLLIDMQGNWGNIATGDSAAAPRYIEARLSKFALEIAFNPKTTQWKLSYDGRNREPICLPMKFPLLLAQGVEGIAVGLASKIFPHNFNELIDASIQHLKGEDFVLYPDFLTGGMIDVSRYNDGLRGGKVRIRAKINKIDKKTLSITELPFGRTTGQLIDSILLANEKNKIKIRKIDDNTAQDVEILVHLLPNISPDVTIDALYAFTDCEISVSPNACIIDGHQPRFVGVKEILRGTAENTRKLLKLELEIRLNELNEAWHFSSLEKIFIENRIYLSIEKCETWESVLSTIDKELTPFKKLLKREVTQEDIAKLTEIKIKRISKFDAFKADEYIRSIENDIKEVNQNLSTITEYTISYYQRIKEKYGKGKIRKTEIRNFETIAAAEVAVANEKLYVNREEGFVGMGLKKDEFIADCSDIDEIIVFKRDGTYVVSKISDKQFFGKDIVHVAVFKKNDERTIYNVAYQDGKGGIYLVKRFFVVGVTRDKEYNLTKGTPDSKIIHFSANPNGEAEILKIIHKPQKRMRVHSFEFDFSTLDIKGRQAMGNILTRHAIHKLMVKEKGGSTLGGREIWYDTTVYRLNTEQRGQFLGEFESDEKLVLFYKNGMFSIQDIDLSIRFDEEVIRIEKYNNEKIYSVIFYDAETGFKNYYLKRFNLNEDLTISRKYSFVGEHPDSKFIEISDDEMPRVQFSFGGGYETRPIETIDAEPFIGVKSFKAHGKRLSNYPVKEPKFIEPIQPPENLELLGLEEVIQQ